MKEKQNNWQRLESVIQWANMSTNYFARYIGLSRGENLYQIKRGNNGISIDVATRVVEKFPQISKLWLLTGEGAMFADNAQDIPVIPFYKVDAEQSVFSELMQAVPDANLILPPVGACDLAVTYMGRAMGSLIPVGTIVLLKAIERDAIIPGEEYAVICRKIVTLRIIRAAEEAGKWRLVAGDREAFDDIVVNASDIKAVYKVKAKIIINN